MSRITIKNPDSFARATIVCLFSFLYSYFYQGSGWNQNAHLDTIWALVNQGSFEITQVASNTQDTASYGGRIYSNKPPGLPLFLAPAYWVMDSVEAAGGLQQNVDVVPKVNTRILTFLGSGLPGIAIVLLLYAWFRRASAMPWQALTLATIFGAGSLLLPYSGVLMSHLLTAAAMFGAWFILTIKRMSDKEALIAGVLAGFAVLTDYLALPAAFLFAGYCFFQHGKKALGLFCLPLTAFGAFIAWYNNVHFGGALRTSYSAENPMFKSSNSFLGVLEVPNFLRLWWITFHPYRGLFYACPVFFAPLFACLIKSKEKFFASKAKTLVVIGIICYFVLFYLSFNGWTGGWSFGPRYLIPILPLAFCCSLDSLRLLRLPTLILALLSVLNMVAVSAVGIMIPAPDTGIATNFNPLVQTFRLLGQNRLSIAPGSYNLGTLVGLPGALSLLPVLVALCALVAGALLLAKQDGKNEEAPALTGAS